MSGGPVPTIYQSDNNTNYYYPLHAYLANAQTGTTAAKGTEPKWPFKRTWMRHIGILFHDGSRDEVPIMVPTNGFFLNGGAISITFPSNTTPRNGVVTGRRGEKLHIGHAAP